MADEIMKKLKEHDDRFDEIKKRLDGHDDQLETIALTVADNKERLDRVEHTTGKVAERLVGMESRLERVEQNMVTKQDHNEMMNTLDEIVKLVRKKDEETTFMSAHVKRVEEKTDKNTADIQKIKPLVGLKATS